MSRIKRWINMHKEEFNADGTLKDEVRQQKLSLGTHPGAIDSYARRIKEEYDEWKHLDETDPEPWTIYTAYDFFSEQEKKEFNPDGSLKPEYIEYAQKIGISESALQQLEWRKKIEVDDYNKVRTYATVTSNGAVTPRRAPKQLRDKHRNSRTF